MLIALPFFLPHDAPDVSLILQEQGWLWAYSSNVAIALWHGAWIWNAGWLCHGMLWSLAVEEHFYLVWPLLVFLLSRRWLLRLSVAIVAFVPVMRPVARLGHVSVVTVYVLTPFRADSLAMGAALALLVRQPELARSFARRVPWAMIVAIAVVIPMGLWRGYFDHYQAGIPDLGLHGADRVLRLYRPGDRDGGRSFAPAQDAVEPEAHLLRQVQLWRVHSARGSPTRVSALPSLRRRPARRGIRASWRSSLTWRSDFAITFALAVVSFRLYESRFLELKRFFEYQRLPVTPACSRGRRDRPGVARKLSERCSVGHRQDHPGFRQHPRSGAPSPSRAAATRDGPPPCARVSSGSTPSSAQSWSTMDGRSSAMRSDTTRPSRATISCCSSNVTRLLVGQMMSPHMPSWTASHARRTVINQPVDHDGGDAPDQVGKGCREASADPRRPLPRPWPRERR